MTIRKPIVKNTPRVYLTLKDAITKKVRGVTVQNATIEQVLEMLEKISARRQRNAAEPSAPQHEGT